MENNQENNQNDTSNTFKGESIRELAHRHMLNPNHTTTDEELKNARIEFSNPGNYVEEIAALTEADNNTVLPPLPFEENATTTNTAEPALNKKATPLPNPYDVLK